MEEVQLKPASTQYRVSIADTDFFFESRDDDTILGSMLRAGLGMPYECNAGGCGSCKFTLFEGTVIEDMEECPGLRQSDRRKNKHLACISRAASDCIIEARLDASYEPVIHPQKIEAVFQSRHPLTHDLWEFTFHSDGPAHFLPGQYAKLHIPGVSAPRGYSMSNTANDDGQWQFQIKRVPGGEATTILFDDDLEGKMVTIDAPYSIAHLNVDSPRSIMCIAGGSGLAPMVSILRGLSHLEGQEKQAILYYGARTSSDIVSPDYFENIPGFMPDQQYVPVLSEPDGDGNYSGPTGYMHEYLATALPDDCSNFDFYIAGPPPMVEAVRRHIVLDRQVPIEQLYYDRFF